MPTLTRDYDSFEDAACNEPQVQEFISLRWRPGRLHDEDLSDESLQFSPEWSSHVSLDYARQLGSDLELRFGVDAMYSDSYEVANDLDPAVAQDSFTKINARIALTSME